MKTRSSIPILFAVAIVAGCTMRSEFPHTRAAAIRSMEPFEGKFLASSNGVDRISLAPLVAAEFILGASSPIPPVFVDRMTSLKGTNLAVFVHISEGGIPSAPYLEVLLPHISGDGPIGRLETTTGARTWISGISVIRAAESGLGLDMLMLEVQGRQVPGVDVVRNYYVVHVQDEWPYPALHLVRLESEGDDLHLLKYGSVQFRTGDVWASRSTVSPGVEWWPLLDSAGPYIGQSIGQQSAEEWCELVENGPLPIQLASMYFLCGQHDTSHPLYVEEVNKARRLLLERGILRRLQGAEHPWIAEYARLLESKANRSR